MTCHSSRPRRLRSTALIRNLVQENHLALDQLVQPIFVLDGANRCELIASMPGMYRYSVDQLYRECDKLLKAGIKSLLLFGIPDKKDGKAGSAYARDGVVQRAIHTIKENYPDFLVITDVCLCEYMEHGHCGVVDKSGRVLNDESVELIAKTALSHASAGCDMVAPSDMMDGRVRAIRQLLDKEGHSHLPIMSYAVKYASAFYGPFREAAQSAPAFGDRFSYQMNPANSREAIREAFLDIHEGADILMVKPALPYLDIISRLCNSTMLPIAAYQVSGEYSMIKAAAANGWIDGDQALLESLLSIRRAGATIIITYGAVDAARLLS